jgi:SAM-dependent methyltransferase
MVAIHRISAKWHWLISNVLRRVEIAFRKYPGVLKLLYKTGVKTPDAPHCIGMSTFQEASAWALDLDHCPCDLQFIEYLKQEKIEGQSIFHFGTGVHHLVGFENQKFDRPNEILGITASVLEHQSYAKAVVKDSSFAKYYKVLFSDIYLLTANLIPMFDIVTLFHLCEFYLPENADQLHQTDETLLALFLEKLRPDGKLLFYTGSNNFHEVAPILDRFAKVGKIEKIGQYKKLLIYGKSIG